jgi:RNA polymerase II C-terminal domain phosphatase-like 1/2
VVEARAVELHLVAMESKLKGVPCFWCWSAQTGLYEACLEMLNQRCLALVFDLDETLVLTNNKETFEKRMEKITSDLKNSELDATTEVALCNELYRVCEDSELLKDFTKTGTITLNHEIVRSQHEEGMLHKPGGVQQLIVRPVIRIPGRNAVLTRIKPMVCMFWLNILQIKKIYFINIRCYILIRNY